MIGSLNRRQIDYLLNANVIGRIGCYAHNRIYVVPVTYVYDNKYIYGHTIEGMKIIMMRNNPDICLEIDQIDALNSWQSAIIWGKYEELEGVEAEEALQIFANRIQPLVSSQTYRPKFGLDRPRESREKRQTVVFRIEIKEATGRYEKP